MAINIFFDILLGKASTLDQSIGDPYRNSNYPPDPGYHARTPDFRPDYTDTSNLYPSWNRIDTYYRNVSQPHLPTLGALFQSFGAIGNVDFDGESKRTALETLIPKAQNPMVLNDGLSVVLSEAFEIQARERNQVELVGREKRNCEFPKE